MLKVLPDTDNELVVNRAFCNLPFTKLILNGWGDVSMCCYQLTQLGNILGDTSVMDLWNSSTAEAIRQETLRGNLHPICHSWNTCPYMVKEKTPYDFQTLKDIKYPTYLEICLPNTHCNIGGENPSDENPACIMCCRNYDLNKQPMVTDILCEKAKPIMPYLRYLCVLGVAEPFWKDAIFQVFEKLGFKTYKHRIRFTTNTNVICLVERTIQRYFEEVHMSDMDFSIDAATPETYMKIRRADAYDLILKNIRTYMSYRDRNGGPDRHRAIIYNNINLINVNEMTKMVETAADLKVDQLVMLPTHDQCGRVSMGELLLNGKNVKIFKKAAEEARRRAEGLGVNLHYSKPFDVVPPPVEEVVQLTVGNNNAQNPRNR